MTKEELLQIIEQAAREKATVLDLDNNQLSSLPPEISQLSSLTTLNLNNNQLSSLPPEISQLSNLTTLTLSENQLSILPLEISQLSNLTWLSLSNNQLSSLPSEISQLSNLTRLSLSNNQLSILPLEISQLSNLTELSLFNNQLSSLPPEISQLSNLTRLSLSNNQLSSLLPEISQLSNLTELSLFNNQLSSLPPEISQLSNLTRLSLSNNQLSSLPPEFSQLSNLTELSLFNNQLSSLPPEISQLSNLTRLSLSNNQLSSLPPEFSQLSNLTRLYLDNNPQLSSPPPEIVEQGTQAILTYLRERLEGSLQQWVSKLLVVGEGGVGKTSLLRVLRGEAFDTQESTTHGIEIKWLDLSHPSKAGTNMHLKTWDFGGQEIYHATHQFFLTNRSLFLLAWNARLGFEQGKLYTTGIHWRNGVLFAYEQEHLALVQAVKSDRYIKLTVRGTNPLNFFVLLRDGIELTLARFPGLDIQRTIPCLGHNGQPCTHEFDYKQLSQRWEKNKGTIECPEAMEDVSVPELLYGLNWNTQNAVLERIDQLEKTVVDTVVDGQTLILDEFKNLLELTQREFTNAFRREQAKIDSHCPNVFVLRLHGDKAWKKNLTGQKLNLQLYCQAPGCWHPTQEGGLYEINEPAKWLRATAPYLGRLFRVLKYAAPIIGPWLGVIDPKEYETLFKNDLELFKEVAAKLPELKQSEDLELADKIARGEDLDPERADGAALRALRQLLDEKDPQQHWGGLKNVLTPEGHYLWLCEHHASEYKR